MVDGLASVGDVLRALLDASHELDPAELAATVAAKAANAGLRDVEIWLVDRQQRSLANLTRDVKTVPVDSSLLGDIFKRGRDHVSDEELGVRVMVPLVDGVDRLGVM